jgi:hypothetical protein
MSRNIVRIPQYSKSWAVVIGINDYQHISLLENAVNDAKQLADLLRNVGFDEVIELYDHNATKNCIISLIVDDDQLPNKINFDDRLLFFFSGHGITHTHKGDGSKTGYLIPSDGEIGKWSSMVEFNDLVQKCINMINVKHVLFLLDCCFSGIASLRSIPTDNTPIPLMPTDEFVLSCTSKKARQIIAAGLADQPVLDDSIFKGHSPFTGAIIQGLRTWEADLHEDGIITASELATYLERKVSDAANIYKHKQKPFANKLPGDEGGDFVILVSQTPKGETLDQFRERMKGYSLAEHVQMIKEETQCLITSLIDAKDVLAVSYLNFDKNIQEFQRRLIALISTIGRIYDPSVKYRVSVNNYPDFSIKKDGYDTPELITIEIPSPILQRYINKEVTLTELWKHVKAFRKESVRYAHRVKELKMDLVI